MPTATGLQQQHSQQPAILQYHNIITGSPAAAATPRSSEQQLIEQQDRA